MNITLVRHDYSKDGIFGHIPELELYTLEHSYANSKTGDWDAKVPLGTYKCVKGVHILSSGMKLQTWEITGVPGHTGILFHQGNYEKDSEGCVLLGMERVGEMVTQSHMAFLLFNDQMEAYPEFDLTVADARVTF